MIHANGGKYPESINGHSTEKDASLSISDILNGLITEVQVAMEAGEEVVFRDALHELAGDFVTDTGQLDNYANLVDRGHMFES